MKTRRKFSSTNGKVKKLSNCLLVNLVCGFRSNECNTNTKNPSELLQNYIP